MMLAGAPTWYPRLSPTSASLHFCRTATVTLSTSAGCVVCPSPSSTDHVLLGAATPLRQEDSEGHRVEDSAGEGSFAASSCGGGRARRRTGSCDRDVRGHGTRHSRRHPAKPEPLPPHVVALQTIASGKRLSHALSHSSVFYDADAWRLAKFQLDVHLDSMDGKDLARVITALALSGQLLSCANTAERLSSRLRRTVGTDLSCHEVANLCYAVATSSLAEQDEEQGPPQRKSPRTPGAENAAKLPLLATLGVAFHARALEANPRDVVLIAQAFAIADIRDAVLFAKLAAVSQLTLSFFSRSEAIHLLDSMAKLQFRHEGLLLQTATAKLRNARDGDEAASLLPHEVFAVARVYAAFEVVVPAVREAIRKNWRRAVDASMFTGRSEEVVRDGDARSTGEDEIVEAAAPAILAGAKAHVDVLTEADDEQRPPAAHAQIAQLAEFLVCVHELEFEFLPAVVDETQRIMNRACGAGRGAGLIRSLSPVAVWRYLVAAAEGAAPGSAKDVGWQNKAQSGQECETDGSSPRASSSLEDEVNRSAQEWLSSATTREAMPGGVDCRYAAFQSALFTVPYLPWMLRIAGVWAEATPMDLEPLVAVCGRLLAEEEHREQQRIPEKTAFGLIDLCHMAKGARKLPPSLARRHIVPHLAPMLERSLQSWQERAFSGSACRDHTPAQEDSGDHKQDNRIYWESLALSAKVLQIGNTSKTCRQIAAQSDERNWQLRRHFCGLLPAKAVATAREEGKKSGTTSPVPLHLRDMLRRRVAVEPQPNETLLQVASSGSESGAAGERGRGSTWLAELLPHYLVVGESERTEKTMLLTPENFVRGEVSQETLAICTEYGIARRAGYREKWNGRNKM